MINRFVIGILGASVGLAVARPVRAQAPLDGRWEGAIHVMGQVLTIMVDFETSLEGLGARIDIPQQGAVGLALTNVSYAAPRVHFELPAGPGLAVFDGRHQGDSISGDFTQAGVVGTFSLSRESASPPAPALAGRWDGAIHIMGEVLTIAVHFESVAAVLRARIDIPQQGAHGLPLTNVRYTPPNVHFELPAGPGLAVFDGQLRGDSIAGEFTQAGRKGTFTLARGAASRSEEGAGSEPPPYAEEEVRFTQGDITLAGTLTVPHAGGPHPAVVMITGSGPQNRDEEIFGFKPFRLIADHLTRNGIAVLRYDDRGVGGSTGSVANATSLDFAKDALAGVQLLRRRPDVDPGQIGLVGHSEGAIVAPLASTLSDDVSFLVLLAGTAVTGEEILYAQGELINRAAGASEAAVERQRRFQRLSFDVVRADSGWEALAAELRAQTQEAVDSMSPQERQAIADMDVYVDTRVNAVIQSIKSPWFRYFLDYDPVPALEHTQLPVLALFGELDLQVPPSVNEERMAAALQAAGNTDHTIRVLPKANHLFLATETGSPSEYATMEKEFVPGFLDTITTWIKERTKG